MRVGFLGIQCETANLGLAALTYAGLRLVHEVAPQDAEFVLFSVNSEAEIARMKRSLGLGERPVIAVPFRHRNPVRMYRSAREIAACDLVIDFTGGDSFSDIYGAPRLVKKLLHKELVLLSGTPLVLAPQTYGPFRSRLLLPWVRHVINRATRVYSRDAQSVAALRRLTAREIEVATDVAVALPWEPTPVEARQPDRLRVGFNVSGLLWNGGYSRDNQFGLRTDYRRYCDAVVAGLLAAGHEVQLIPHVVSRGNAENEDDIAASREVARNHPECTLAPLFADPVEAKSYIASMDVFIGSRMHATIAAFTSGIPTVPAAYSRKFSGFFANLGYSTVVDLVELDEEASVQQTLNWVANHQALTPLVLAGNERARASIRVFTKGLSDLMAQTSR